MNAPARSSPKEHDVRCGDPPPFRPAHILVPVDFSAASRRAVCRARALAESFGARLILVHVVEPSPALSPLDYVPVGEPHPDDDRLTAARAALAATAAELAPPVPTEQIVRFGRAWREIVDQALRRHADLLLVPNHGDHRRGPAYLGSVAEKIVRHAPCPVLVLRDGG
ncbi:MAG: universal stress protein [Limisphaerales bacterium]